MLPHAGPLYHANALSSFSENNTTQREDSSAYFSPPVHTARATQSGLNCEARAKIPQNETRRVHIVINRLK